MKKTKFCLNTYEFSKLLQALKFNGFDVVKQSDNTYRSNGKNYIFESQVPQCLEPCEDNSIDENALFHQMCEEKGLDISKIDIDKKRFLKEIIYLSFNDSRCASFKLTKYEKEIEALFADGFKVYKGTPNGNKTQLGELVLDFRMFDKSGSMGRQSKISMLSTIGYDGTGDKKIKYDNTDFYERISLRCHLGLDEVVKSSQVLAKRYSYRGLMMSGGNRITLRRLKEKNIELNENTVLIVPDYEIQTLNEVKYFTQKEKELKVVSSHTYCDFEKEPIVQSSLRDETINDGYGFITPEFGKIIYHEFNAKKVHHSFQIRLPYTKGVVHTVDFYNLAKDKFLKDGLIHIRAYDKTLKEIDKVMTLEEFSNVKMIISKSVFKCFNELKEFQELRNTSSNVNDHIDNVLKYYFDSLYEYNHSLFILAMDKVFDNKNTEPEYTYTNYQFLSTLDLSKDDFLKLFEESEKKYQSLKTDDNARLAYICGNNDYELSTDEDFEDEKVSNRFTNEAVILKANNSSLCEARFKNIISDTLSSILNDIKIGHLLIKGEDRFLCGDPLRYLYFLFNPGKEEKDYLPSDIILDDNCFIAAGFHGVNGKEYPILRNPHLSRNEDLILRLFTPSDDSIRNNYGFENLTGVCIIDPTHSYLPAETIGGADYDGDHVKIFDNDIYTEAIKKHKGFEYPLVINGDYKKLGNSDSDSKIDNYHNKCIVNLSTFDNYVGDISNNALVCALRAYTEKSLDTDEIKEKYTNYVRLLGILTGLETDSAKTGIKPYYDDIAKEISHDKCIHDINNGNQQLQSADRFFIDSKNSITRNKPQVKDLICRYLNYDQLFESKNLLTIEDYIEYFYKTYGRQPLNIELLRALSLYVKQDLPEKCVFDYKETFFDYIRNNKDIILEENVKRMGDILKCYSSINSYLRKISHRNSNEFTLNTKELYNIFDHGQIEHSSNPYEDIIEPLIEDIVNKAKTNRSGFRNLILKLNATFLKNNYISYNLNIKEDQQKASDFISLWFKRMFSYQLTDLQLLALTYDKNVLKFVLREASYQLYKYSYELDNYTNVVNSFADVYSKTSDSFKECWSIEDFKERLCDLFDTSVSDIVNSIIDQIDIKYLSKSISSNIKRKTIAELTREIVPKLKNIYKQETTNPTIKNLDYFIEELQKGIFRIINKNKPSMVSEYNPNNIVSNQILKSIIDKYQAKNIFSNDFGVDIDENMIILFNDRRFTLYTEDQIIIRNIFSNVAKRANGSKCDAIVKYIKEYLVDVIKVENADILTNEQKTEKQIIQIIGAIILNQEEFDKNQTFLFNAYGNELAKACQQFEKDGTVNA